MKNIGDKIYKYVAKNGGFFVHEYKIIRDFDYRMKAYRESPFEMEKIPKDDEYGIVHNGIILWLSERNDELAKQIFIQHKEERILELQKLIDSHLECIEMLKKES